MTIVFKIGTNVLLGNQDALNLELMQNLTTEISKLHKQGRKIIIVTSGAIATGQSVILKRSILRSTAAAIGQPELIRYYVEFFLHHKIKVAQILLSPNSFKNRGRYDNLKKTLQELLDNHIIPVINENDVTILKDTFGDNDSLAAIIAVITEANKLIYLTNTEGLYAGDPQIKPNTQIIKEIKNVDLEIQKMCFKKTSSLGRGGMLSKLKGAKLATNCGIETFIINGLQPKNISKLIAKENIGTKFMPQKGKLSERKKWLLIGTISPSKIIVDQGARAALENKNSLLAVGIRGIKGDFAKGEFVNIADSVGEIFAFGLANYSFQELLPLNKLRDKNEIKKRYAREIIHIDNLILLK